MKTRIVIASIIFVFPIYASRSSGEITSPVDGICQADIVKTSGHQCQEFEVNQLIKQLNSLVFFSFLSEIFVFVCR